MDYDLADYNNDTAAIDCQLTVAGLTGVQNAYAADGSYLRTRLDGRWKLNFTASSGDTANRIGTVSEPEVNGYTLSSVIAAPGETRVTVQLSADTPERRHATAVLRGWPKAAMRQQPPQCRQQRRQLRL